MENIWSKNKYIEILVNILLMLMSINFLHFGQLILPIICFILFVDNKFEFKVNNIKVFVLLSLFAISFCYFSYDLGFFCVMGFTLPMAYYIGSNVKEPNKDKVKKIIYLITLGMCIHCLLNLGYDFSKYGIKFFRKSSHYDFWVKDIIASTILSVHSIFILGIFYYIFFYENNKNYKIIGVMMFIITNIYNLGLGRRTTVLLLIITLFLLVLIDKLIFKTNKISNKLIINTLICILFITAIIVILYIFNIFNIRKIIDVLTLFEKFSIEGFKSGRIEILLKGIVLIPDYLFGGQMISTIVGMPFHDLLLDIYDYAGIIPFLLMFICVIYYLITIYKFIKNNKDNEYNILIIGLNITIILVMCIEPIITGSSLILICIILIFGALESLNNE